MRRHVALGLVLAALAGLPTTGGAQRTASAPEVVAYLEPGMVGVWDVWISGAVQYHTDGRSVYQRYSPGSAMNRFEIKPNGDYQWGAKKGMLAPAKPWFARARRRVADGHTGERRPGTVAAEAHHSGAGCGMEDGSPGVIYASGSPDPQRPMQSRPSRDRLGAVPEPSAAAVERDGAS